MNKKIGLWLAILININIVVGGGFFITATDIGKVAGPYAPLCWLVVGALLLPLTLVLASLANRYPVGGGLYVYPQKLLGNNWGFFSGWSYFIGTAAGNALVLHEFSKLATGAVWGSTSARGLLALDGILLVVFGMLNLLNIQFLGKMQVLFTVLKSIPFAIVALGSIALFSVSNLTPTAAQTSTSMFYSIPLVLFAYIGIEACCSISNIIQDADRNTSRAILISFGIIIALYAGLQFLLVGIHGPDVENAFLDIVPKLTTSPIIRHLGDLLIRGCMLASYLGGFYSMYYANTWHLNAMANEKSLRGSTVLQKLNSFGYPWVCLLVQATMIFSMLVVTQELYGLAVMGDFGIVIAYLLSVAAFFALIKIAQGSKQKIITGALAFAGTGFIFYHCVEGLWENGVAYALPYLALLGLGLLLYQNRKDSPRSREV